MAIERDAALLTIQASPVRGYDCSHHINYCHRGDHPIVLGQVKNNKFVDPGEIPPILAGLKQERLSAKDQMKQERRALAKSCHTLF